MQKKKNYRKSNARTSEPCLTQLKVTDMNVTLIAHELSRLNVDIAALSEVHFPREGSLQEHRARYTFFWSGKPTTEGIFSGVGFMISTSIASKLENQPTGHSDRLPLKNMPRSNSSSSTCRKIRVLFGAPQLSPKHPCRRQGDNTW